MVSIRSAVLALLLVASTSGWARERTAEEDLRYYLNAPVSGGDVFSQGKLDGIDYRKLLRGTVAYDRPSLAGIFRYTANGRLMGEGAETNSIILHAVLHHWGDARFAAVLRVESTRVRKAVVAELDYGWGYPGWKSHEFPITYQLAKHQKIATSPP
jgi:hypothetical protein